jgi:ubiquinone/menaquinone biosynthesis C-methylase UbiE
VRDTSEQRRSAFTAYDAEKARRIGELRGRVLELGAGKGSNFGLLHREVEWLGLEPNARRHRALRAAAARHGFDGEVLTAGAESVPLPDHSVSGVLSTITLCSVRDLDACLREVARVLRPGGVLVFAEHVAAARSTLLWRLQRTVSPFSARLDHGCRYDRETGRHLEGSGLFSVEATAFDLPVLGPLTVPFLVGRAVLR